MSSKYVVYSFVTEHKPLSLCFFHTQQLHLDLLARRAYYVDKMAFHGEIPVRGPVAA